MAVCSIGLSGGGRRPLEAESVLSIRPGDYPVILIVLLCEGYFWRVLSGGRQKTGGASW